MHSTCSTIYLVSFILGHVDTDDFIGGDSILLDVRRQNMLTDCNSETALKFESPTTISWASSVGPNCFKDGYTLRPYAKIVIDKFCFSTRAECPLLRIPYLLNCQAICVRQYRALEQMFRRFEVCGQVDQ